MFIFNFKPNPQSTSVSLKKFKPHPHKNDKMPMAQSFEWKIWTTVKVHLMFLIQKYCSSGKNPIKMKIKSLLQPAEISLTTWRAVSVYPLLYPWFVLFSLSWIRSHTCCKRNAVLVWDLWPACNPSWGLSNNYIDKKGWVGGQSNVYVG